MMETLLSIFLSFVQIGLFSFGGGYAAIPLIQQQVVNIHQWLTMEAFTDLVTISEMTPGPIAINSATFVGLQVAGLPGALVGTFALVLPSCIIVSLLSLLYRKYRDLYLMQGILSGIRPAVVAMIASAGVSIFLTALWPGGLTTDWLHTVDIAAVLLFAAAFFALRKWKLNPIVIIVGSGVVGAVLFFLGISG